VADDPFEEVPGEWRREERLRDGADALLRSIRPEDRDRLAEAFGRLSPTSRYLRFHADVERLSDAQLDFLTRVDHHDHEAIVALDRRRPERPGLGVARYVRDPDDPTVAEAAVTVADEHQGRGVGTVLLGALATRARSAGITTFRSYVLDGNTMMLRVFDDLGAHRERDEAGPWRVDLEIPEDAADVPDSPVGRAFLRIARDEHVLASELPPIWSRWRRAGRDRVDPTGDDEHHLNEVSLLAEELERWLADRSAR